MNQKDFVVGKKYFSPSIPKPIYFYIGEDSMGRPTFNLMNSGGFYTLKAIPDWRNLQEYRELREFWVVCSTLHYTKVSAENYAEQLKLPSDLIIHVKEALSS